MTWTLAQGLGLEYAKQLAGAGCRSLVVTSRHPCLPREVLEAFASQGVALWAVQADAGDAARTAEVLAWAREQVPAVQHYAHAAGVTAQTLLKVIPSQHLLTIREATLHVTMHMTDTGSLLEVAVAYAQDPAVPMLQSCSAIAAATLGVTAVSVVSTAYTHLNAHAQDGPSALYSVAPRTKCPDQC